MTERDVIGRTNFSLSWSFRIESLSTTQNSKKRRLRREREEEEEGRGLRRSSSSPSSSSLASSSQQRRRRRRSVGLSNERQGTKTEHLLLSLSKRARLLSAIPLSVCPNEERRTNELLSEWSCRLTTNAREAPPSIHRRRRQHAAAALTAQSPIKAGLLACLLACLMLCWMEEPALAHSVTCHRDMEPACLLAGDGGG